MSVCKDRKGQDKLLHIFVVFCIAVLFGALIAHIPPHNEWTTAIVALDRKSTRLNSSHRT